MRWLLFAVCFFAAAEDLLRRKVSNKLLAAGAMACLWLCFRRNNGAGLRMLFQSPEQVLPLLFTGFLTFKLHEKRLLGAGDGKLLLLLSAFLPGEDYLNCVLLSLFAAGAWSAAVLLRYGKGRERLRRMLAWFGAMGISGGIPVYPGLGKFKKEDTIPFAAAVGLGYGMMMAGLRLF